MPVTPSFLQTLTLSGMTFSRSFTVQGDVAVTATPSVPAAKPGSLTTRTDNDTATLTMNSGHGFLTNDKIDVFWSGGSRRNMTATVTGDSVVVDGGSGDNLPPATTALTAMKPTEMAFAAVGNNVDALGVASPANGWVVFRDGSNADIAAYQLDPATALGGSSQWAAGSGTNPLAGATVAKVLFSHGSTAAAVMTAAVAY